MFYIKDFKVKTVVKVEPLNNAQANEFSLVITNKERRTTKVLENSIINAAKPLIFFASIFGLKVVRFSKGKVFVVNIFYKLYSLLCILVIYLSVPIFQFSITNDTLDLPLKILTTAFLSMNSLEAIYSILIVAFYNSKYYVRLFETFDKIDHHFGTSKALFKKRRLIAMLIVTIPVIKLLSAALLKKVTISRVGIFLAFFIAMLQEAIILFLLLNVYVMILNLNVMIKMKALSHLQVETVVEFDDDDVMKSAYDLQIIQMKLESRYSWYEIMQIYDKIADCIYYFNMIYEVQILLMFFSWFISTLYIVCRFISPASERSRSSSTFDIFIYLFLSGRPILLSKVSGILIAEERKTLALLSKHLIHSYLDDDYFTQVQTMMELVETRSLRVSAGVFDVDIKTILRFTGRVVSYAVLIIQYFYMHVLQKLIKGTS